MSGLGVLGDVWKRINEFVNDIKDLKTHDKETDAQLRHFHREVELVNKQLAHMGKVQDAQGKEAEDLKARIKKLETEKHGLAISAGKAKAKVAKLQQAKH